MAGGPSHPPHNAHRRATSALRGFVALSAATYALLLVLLGVAPEVAGPVYVVFGVTALFVVARRVRGLPGPIRRAASYMLLAGASSVAGAVLRAVHGTVAGIDYPFPSPADLFSAAAYPLFLAAIITIVRQRVGRITADLVLDAVVGGVAAGLLQWQLILLPYLETTTADPAARAMNVAYSLLSILLVMAACMALVAGGNRTTSNRLLAAGLLATVALDVVATLITAGRAPEELRLVLAPLVFILGGAGLLHPSVIHLMERPSDPAQVRRLTNKRIGVLALALLAAPILMVAGLAGSRSSLWLPAVGALALAPLVLVRLGRLVRENEGMAILEATLRSVGERLVGAESPADVQRVITVGAGQVLGGELHGGGLLLDPQDETPGAEALPSHVIADLRARLRDGTPPGDRLVDLDDGWLAGTAVVQGRVRAALLVPDGPDLTPARARALVALCREASIGLRAVDQAELNVRQRSEERFASLIDNSSDIVTILDPMGRITYVSPVARRLLGYPLRYVEGLPALDLVHPDDRGTADALVADVRRGQRDGAEMRLRHVAGTYHWFEVVGVDLSADPNIAGIVLTAREIGDRKTAEEQLQLSEARFKALVQRSSDLVLVVDPTAGVRYVSPSVTTVVGLEEQDALGRPLEELFRDSGTDWEVALRRAAPRDGTHPELLEFGFRNAMDEWVHLEATVSDLRAEPSVGGFVLNARDVTERTSMLQRLRYQATHDDLTGLPNRILAAEELSGMLARNGGNSTVAVVSVDLDDFKDVNDSLGLAHGDDLLRAAADRIITSLAFGDLVARVGGDEFLVVLERAHGEDRVLEVAERILTDLAQPFGIAGRELSLTASAGIAFDHDRTSAAEVLLRNADTAMYKAKEQGKRQAVVFEAEMHTASFDRLELRADLARAVETDQLVAHYQPIVDLQTHRVVGCEALVRWQHPRRGLLSPAIFVPLAEETGLIGRLGEWILERACRDLAGWRRQLGEGAADLTISVNLSAQELHSERLLPTVTSILNDTGLPADRLVLEVTESNLLTDTDVVQDRMERLRSLGARLAIDDFGTGYSSLGYIHRFDFDVLKIDRSFVEGLERPTNRRIVTAVIDLARELGVRVVAEGIEEEDQERILVELGCPLGQGYKFSRPVPAVEFARLLRSPATTVS